MDKKPVRLPDIEIVLYAQGAKVQTASMEEGYTIYMRRSVINGMLELATAMRWDDVYVLLRPDYKREEVIPQIELPKVYEKVPIGTNGAIRAKQRMDFVIKNKELVAYAQSKKDNNSKWFDEKEQTLLEMARKELNYAKSTRSVDVMQFLLNAYKKVQKQETTV